MPKGIDPRSVRANTWTLTPNPSKSMPAIVDNSMVTHLSKEKLLNRVARNAIEADDIESKDSYSVIVQTNPGPQADRGTGGKCRSPVI